MKNLSKINEQIKEVLNSINEFSEKDLNQTFDTREGYIVANIKVYDWLDNEDVWAIIQSSSLQANEAQILEEFTDERLSNIYNHVCETEVRYLKDVYEKNMDILDFKKILSIYAYAHKFETLQDVLNENINASTSFKYYLENYFNIAKKHKTYKGYVNYIKKKNLAEFNEFYKRDLINFECWQFGRSGGWFSICKESELKKDYLYNYLGYPAHDLLNECNNDVFNNILNDSLLNYKETKSQFLSRIKQELKEVQSLFNAVEQIIKDIESNKKYFKDSLASQLEYEIQEFCSENLNIENTNVSISLAGEIVKTSLGVTVEAKEFKTNLIEVLKELRENSELEELPINRKVGNYFVEYARKIEGDYLIKAGCHRFSLNNILSTFNLIY